MLVSPPQRFVFGWIFRRCSFGTLLYRSNHGCVRAGVRMAGSQAFISHVNGNGVPPEPGSDLDQALLFVRVSTMKMLRLQLALERRDRAVALQTVDDLVELDEWIARCAGQLPIDDVFEALADEADEQREALLHEKFGLAAGLVKRGPDAWPDQEIPVRPAAKESAVAVEEAEPAPWRDMSVEVDWGEVQEKPGSRRWLWMAALAALLLGAIAGAVLWLGGI